MHEIVKFGILNKKNKIHNFGRNMDHIGANFVGPEVLEPSQYFYLTITHMKNSYFTYFHVLECVFCTTRTQNWRKHEQLGIHPAPLAACFVDHAIP